MSGAREHPRVTMIVFGYNQAAWIEEAFRSALAQTYRPLEIIASDDASTDGTFEIMQKVAAEYTGPHTIRLNRNPTNLGVGDHVNRAVSMASGDYIVFQAGDDISLPRRVELCMNSVYEQGELAAVFGKYQRFGHNISPNAPWEPLSILAPRTYRAGEYAWLEEMISRVFPGFPGCVAMWNRRLFVEFGRMPSYTIAEDVILGNRAVLSGMGLQYIPECVLHYRVHGSNLTAGQKAAFVYRRCMASYAAAYHEAGLYLQKHSSELPEGLGERYLRYLERDIYGHLHKISGLYEKVLRWSLVTLLAFPDWGLRYRLRLILEKWSERRTWG